MPGGNASWRDGEELCPMLVTFEGSCRAWASGAQKTGKEFPLKISCGGGCHVRGTESHKTGEDQQGTWGVKKRAKHRAPGPPHFKSGEIMLN